MILLTSPRQFPMAAIVADELSEDFEVDFAVFPGRCSWHVQDWSHRVKEFGRPYNVIPTSRIEQTSAGIAEPILSSLSLLRGYWFLARVPKLLAARRSVIRYLRNSVRYDLVASFTIPSEVFWAFREARRRGAKTIVIQEGIWLEASRSRRPAFSVRCRMALNRFSARLGFPLQGGFTNVRGAPVDAYCVAGEHPAQLLTDVGIPKNRIIATGIIDEHLLAAKLQQHLADLDRSSTSTAVAASKDPVRILFVKQSDRYASGEDEQLVVDLVEFIRTRPNTELTIKLHPNDPATPEFWVERLRSRCGDIVRTDIVKAGDLFELLSMSDVVVTVYSGVAIQAVMMGIPLLTIDYLTIRFSLDWLHRMFDAAMNVTERSNLEASLARTAFDDAFREKMRQAQQASAPRIVAAMDGNAVARIGHIARTLVQ